MKVQIKETLEILEVKKDYGDVLTCYIKEPFYFHSNILVDTIIISKDKVNFINSNQLELF